MTPSPAGPKDLTQHAVRSAMWLGSLNVGASLFVVLLLTFLNHHLENAPAEMASWQVLLPVFLFSAVICGAGLSAAVVRRETLTTEVLLVLARIQISMGVLGTLALYFGAGLLASLFPAQPQAVLAGLFRLSSPIILLICLGLPQKALIERALSFRRVAIIESSATLLYVAVGSWLGVRYGARGLVLATLVRHSAEFVAYWWSGPLRLRELLVGRGSLRDAWGDIRFAAALLLQTVLALTVRNVDRFLVAAFLPGAAIAVYGQVQALIALPMTKLGMFALRVAMPTFAKVQGDRARLLRGLQRLQHLVALAACPVLAGLAAVAPQFLRLYLGPQFAAWAEGNALVMRLLALGALAQAYSQSMSVVLNSAGEAGRLLVRQAISAVVVLLLVSATATRGLGGMAAARSLAILFAGALILSLARHRLKLSSREAWANAWRPLIAAGLMYLVVIGVGMLVVAVDPVADPYAPEVGLSDRAVLRCLVIQVAVGAATYFALLQALGLPLRSLPRLLRSSSANARAAAAEGRREP